MSQQNLGFALQLALAALFVPMALGACADSSGRLSSDDAGRSDIGAGDGAGGDGDTADVAADTGRDPALDPDRDGGADATPDGVNEDVTADGVGEDVCTADCPADCGGLEDPDNGQVSAASTTEDATATYSCDSGFDLTGSATRTCQANGSWSGSAPTCQNINECDASPCVAGAACDDTDGSFTCTCRAGFESPDATSDPCVATGVNAHLLFYYPLDDNTWNYGSLGAGFDGVATAGTLIAGVVGNAIGFDDATSGAGMRVEGTRTALSGSADYTISFWLREPAGSGGSAFTTYASGEGCSLLFHGGAVLRSECRGASAFDGTADVGSDQGYNLSNWHHFLFRYDGSGAGAGAGAGGDLEIFLDGISVVSIANPTDVDLFSTAQTDFFVVGSQSGFVIDDFRIYDSAFTPQQQCEQAVGGLWATDHCDVANCTDGTRDQRFGPQIVGCSGSVAFTDRDQQCGGVVHTCSAQEWIDREGLSVPEHHYWTDDDLLWGADAEGTGGGTSGDCFVTLNPDFPDASTSCSPGEPMRVCAPAEDEAHTDPETNICNWIDCGYEETVPDGGTDEYFGGCEENPTAGTLCCAGP